MNTQPVEIQRTGKDNHEGTKEIQHDQVFAEIPHQTVYPTSRKPARGVAQISPVSLASKREIPRRTPWTAIVIRDIFVCMHPARAQQREG